MRNIGKGTAFNIELSVGGKSGKGKDIRRFKVDFLEPEQSANYIIPERPKWLRIKNNKAHFDIGLEYQFLPDKKKKEPLKGEEIFITKENRKELDDAGDRDKIL